MRTRLLFIVTLLSTIVLASGLVGCARPNSGPVELIIDQTATATTPKSFEINGLKGQFYYQTTEMSSPSGISPSIQWRLDVTDGNGPKYLSAKLELRHNGDIVNAYKHASEPSEGWVKNELIAEVKKWSVASYIPEDAPSNADESSTYIGSETGTDFVFTLREIQVSSTPVTPQSVFTPTTTPPTFDTSTPEGRFNKLAAEKGWSPPASFVSSDETDQYYRADPSEHPAAAVHSFISQVNEWGNSGYATTSPTQIFAQWMKDWNPEMLASGISALGDAKIKNTYRDVKAGHIELWFGNGTHVIGTGQNQMPPGTYHCTAPGAGLIKEGYWERTSSSGDIIENNFVTSAREATVTIAPTDGQFTSQRMCTWKPVS